MSLLGVGGAQRTAPPTFKALEPRPPGLTQYMATERDVLRSKALHVHVCKSHLVVLSDLYLEPSNLATRGCASPPPAACPA